jgi:tetratricopeptide (TPR) repeat protein
MAALDEAQIIAQRLSSAEQRSRIHHVRGNLYFVRGDGVACRTEHEAALQHAQQAGDSECEAQALSGLGDAQYILGRLATGLDYFLRCVALCERAGLPKVEIPNRCMVGHCLYYLNRMEESVAQIRLSLDEARRIGQVQSEIFALESLGFLLVGRGDYEAAETAILCGIPIARTAGARRYLAMLLYALAQVRLVGGARAEARAHLDEALALAHQTGMAFAGPMILSGIACAEQDPTMAKLALEQGEAVLSESCMSHCYLHFYRNSIDVSLQWGSWDQALRYAARLEDYVSAEPLAWASLIIERARGLAAAGAGQRSDALRGDLQRIRKELERVGMRSALPRIDLALTTM